MIWCSVDNWIVQAKTPLISINGQNINRSDRLKYLGITFDQSLSYMFHVEQVQKCKRGLAAIKTMAAAKLDQRLLVLLFNQLVLSVVDYGLGLLTLSDKQWKEYRMKECE